MKIRTNIFSCITFVLSVITLYSCKSTEFEDNENSIVEIESLNFTLTDEPFGEEKQLTRSIRKPTTKTIDLGDDLITEVSIENDIKEKAITRTATPLSDGTYFIYVVDSEGKRVKGAQKLAKGQVTAGVFKIDPSYPLRIPAGKYTFICYNEYVSDDGDKLTVNNDERARIGSTTQTVTSSPSTHIVKFEMKRQVARVRFKITAYTQVAPDIEAKLVSTTDQPTTICYTDLISTPQTINSTAINRELDFPTTSNTKNILAYDFFTPLL